MERLDLAPAAERMADLVRTVGDDQLAAPTPCPDYRLGDLLDHIGGLSVAFAGAARKERGEATQAGPSGDASRLGADWRTRIPGALEELAAAWRDPGAWAGETHIAGFDSPAAEVAMVALDELVIHGWDVARALGRPYEPDAASLGAVHDFVSQFADPEARAAADGLFGPVVEVPEDAPLLDRVIGLAGRDPSWTPG
jgi:uncharacterized protein (TIGR03086 family)